MAKRRNPPTSMHAGSAATSTAADIIGSMIARPCKMLTLIGQIKLFSEIPCCR